jgi:hypothetical protein
MKPAPFTLVYAPTAAAAASAVPALAHPALDLSAAASDRRSVLANARAEASAAPPWAWVLFDPVLATKPISEMIEKQHPMLAKQLKELPPPLVRSLLASAHLESGTEQLGIVDVLQPVIADLSRAKDVVTVALWDIDARVGLLSEVIAVLNRSQPAFTFFNLQAPIPAGLVVDTAHSAAWARTRGKRRMTKTEQEEFANNLMSDDFFKHAQQVHKNIGVHYLVGITRYMVAGTDEDGELFWNYIAVTKRKSMVVSAYDLRDFARKADRPFEVAVAALVIAQVLDATNKRLSFHRKDTGCLFDFNESRVSLVKTMHDLKIDDGCLKKMDPKDRDAAVAMIDALRSYTRPSTVASVSTAMHNDTYWFKQLANLTKRVKKESKA